MNYMDEDPYGLPVSGESSLDEKASPMQWEELRHEIKKTRRLALSMNCKVPFSFTFRHLHTESGDFTRLYFLGMTDGHRENTLLYVDLPIEMKPESELQEVLKWKPLLDSFHPSNLTGQYSREEQLMRERRRLCTFGITSYDYNDMNGDFVFPACNSLFIANDTIVNSAGVLEDYVRLPKELRTSSIGARLDAVMCPHNPKLIAYVCEGDLWVYHLSGKERRLTNTRTGDGGLRENPISAGMPSFVIQEEFDRFVGFWWQPSITKNNVYMILYEEVDESDVEILRISCTMQDSEDEYRYPRAGSTNARSTLKLIQFQVKPNGTIKNVVEKTMAEPLSSLFPDAEYIVQAGWHPTGESFYAELLNRRQQKLQLILIQLSYMVNVGTENEEPCHISSDIEPLQILLEESNNTWINTSEIIHFFPITTVGQISFIWSSERTGYRHLYLVTSSLARPLEMCDEASYIPIHSITDQPHTNVVIEMPLTTGEWPVLSKQIYVDEKNHLVYFTGRKDSPLETHLYCVSYTNPGSISRLTQLGYSHSIAMDSECQMFVTLYSNIKQTPACEVYQITTNNKVTRQLSTAHPIATLHTHRQMSDDYKPPELFKFNTSDGCELHGMFYLPNNYKAGTLYPTVLFVYGGPQVQMVSNVYRGVRFMRLHTLALIGYVVVVIDSRGSSGRGQKFEAHLKGKLGLIEIQDQVEGLHWLASTVGIIDLNRVAIHGWSYGGFLSIMALAQRPDVFKLAISGAPVTSWDLYDTGYTERYLGLPNDNPQVYKKSSVIDYVERLPDEPNRLMIFHGMIDENVHFSHTLALINALLKAVKPYQLQIFPNERHGIRHSSEHYETALLSFLQQHL